MNNSDDSQRYSIRAIDRALRILMGFTTADAELTIAALAASADVPRSTAFRILATTARRGAGLWSLAQAVISVIYRPSTSC